MSQFLAVFPLSFSLPLGDIPIARNKSLPSFVTSSFFFFFFNDYYFAFLRRHHSFVPALPLPLKSTFFFSSLFWGPGVALPGAIAGDSRATPASQRPHPHRHLKCSRGADSNMSPQLSFSRGWGLWSMHSCFCLIDYWCIMGGGVFPKRFGLRPLHVRWGGFSGGVVLQRLIENPGQKALIVH